MGSEPSFAVARRVLLAGLAYFTAAFALGFVLGAARAGLLALYPAMGRLGAVALEIPVMLAACWFICRRVIAAFDVPAAWTTRTAMGALAFALLQGAEMTLGVRLMKLDLATQIAMFATPAGALGLSAQVVYGLFPLLTGLRASRDTH
jgi:hypothetical protein